MNSILKKILCAIVVMVVIMFAILLKIYGAQHLMIILRRFTYIF